MAATARVIWLCVCVRYWPYRILVPRPYDLLSQRWDRQALVSAMTGCREIQDIRERMSNSLSSYCACSILVRGALGMTILTTEKFKFLLIESWLVDLADGLKAVRDPLNLLQLAENLEL